MKGYRECEGATPIPEPHSGGLRHRLTGRELEILTLAARGLTSYRIGRRLGISEKTVKNRLTVIYGKLAVGCRAEAIGRVVASGLVRP
ncbi:response regulator transcription factor [Nocardia thraciensis]